MTLFFAQPLFATGEPSTYFQIYVPPNNDAVKRDAALIVTAIHDSTYFQIIDDGADGDTDDSKSGYLMAGQSYVLYIRDNGINDDARYASGGTLKWDGDYFIIKSDKLVFASQSTNSDWQHDWVPSTDKKSIGQKFIIYAPPYTSSKRDVNVFAYQPGTTVTFQKISFQPKTNTGFTDVNMDAPVTLFTRTLNPGQDLIYTYADGRDVMDAGETYLVLADKPVTLQYGALYGNERDGGGYVPSSNGSSSGSLLYFAVPFQSGTSGEQEIRIVSWDDNNTVLLERYQAGTWTSVKSFSLGRMKGADWTGRANGNINYPTVFRITCTSGKRVSVFEGNWFETGSPGTSDMATMVSAENGTSSGTSFLSYICPPGNEQNVVNPFTGTAFGQQMTHLYIFAREGALVTVKDAYTNGTKFNRSYTINAERYVDCALTLAEWKNIYNGTGTASGPERPYLLVESNKPVSVMNSNFNDNWMCYFGSSLEQSFTGSSVSSQSNAIPADTLVVTTTIQTGSQVNNPTLQVVVEDGLKVVNSTLNQTVSGNINELPDKTIVNYPTLPPLQGNQQYVVETTVTARVGDNTGTILNTNQAASVETVLTGQVGGQVQQASSTSVVNINTANTTQLMFSRYTDNVVTTDSTDSWTASWADINQDGYDDIFVTDRRSNKPNLIYMNDRNGGFYRGQSLAADSAISMSHTWADADNNGYPDLLVLNNTRKPNTFYRNTNGVLTKDNSLSFTQVVSYYHGGSFADYDNDGRVDLFMCNYFPTRYNELHRNNGAAGFVKELVSVIPAEANQSVGASWADYDGDGFQDLFVPNGTGNKNSLFHNEGNGSFTKVQNIITAEGGQSVGSCWGDYDNDGDPDLYVTNSNATGNFLYRNEGNGSFTRITNSMVCTDKGNSHGCSFADIDNDGDLDLYVTNDKNFKFLYMNSGDGSFTAKTDELICFNFGNAFGHSWSDFDHDGDLDLFVATHSNQRNGFFVNNGNGNKWLAVTLTGTSSNRSAIGARLCLYTAGKVQYREVNSQSGFGGMSSFTQHFGLASLAQADSLVIRWPSGINQVITNISANQFLSVTEPQSIPVAGGVYFDENGNGQRDAGEALAGRAAVRVEGASSKIYTGNQGYFSIALSPGTYSFRLLNEKGLNPATPDPVIRTINPAAATVDSVWLPATPVCANPDLELLMGGTAIRKGFTNNYFTIILNNKGRYTPANVSVNMRVPASLTLTNLNIPYQSVQNIQDNNVNYKQYTWNMQGPAPFTTALMQFQQTPDAGLNIGDTVQIRGWAEMQETDCSVSDNSMSQTYRVVGAIDPNDLQVVPPGLGEEGYIPASQTLVYTVRFQNTGNHTAESVEIVDQLPAGLDMSSLRVITQSHPGMRLTIEGRTAYFRFPDLFLPDSVSDEAGSQGYVVFSITPERHIMAGTVLRNRASIQFDHYAPVETNEVRNTILSAKQEEDLFGIQVYPNPAADVVYVKMKEPALKLGGRKLILVQLLDLFGRVITQSTACENETLRLDIPALGNGAYLLKATDNTGRVHLGKLAVIRPR